MTTTNDKQPETIKAGKTTLTRTPGGTIKFLSHKGHQRSVSGPEWDDLFFTIRDGSGEEAKIARVDTVYDPKHPSLHNVHSGHRGNEWRQHGTGGNWIFPHGQWNE